MSEPIEIVKARARAALSGESEGSKGQRSLRPPKPNKARTRGASAKLPARLEDTEVRPRVAGVNSDRDLAAEFRLQSFVPPNLPKKEPSEKQLANRFQKGNPGSRGYGKDVSEGKKANQEIKKFMAELLDDPKYRRNLVRRIKAGVLPSVELFLLTKAIGKPKEEVEITANVPLFSLPTTFLLKEDEVVEAEGVKLLEEGVKDEGNPVGER